MTLGQRVKKLRKDKKLTQTELGGAVGVTYQNIQNLEKGGVDNPRYLIKLADFFGVSTDYLLNGTDTDNPAFRDLDAELLSECMNEVLQQAEKLGRKLDAATAAKLTAYVYSQSIKTVVPKVVQKDVAGLVALMSSPT